MKPIHRRIRERKSSNKKKRNILGESFNCSTQTFGGSLFDSISKTIQNNI